MAIDHRQHRGSIVYPSPDDTDQARVNSMLVDAVKALSAKVDSMNAENRLTVLEKKVADHADFIDG